MTANPLPEERLLPCPFCGSENTSLSVGKTGGEKPMPMRYAECDICGANAGWSSTEGEVIAAWNRRAAGREDAVARADAALAEHMMESSDFHRHTTGKSIMYVDADNALIQACRAARAKENH